MVCIFILEMENDQSTVCSLFRNTLGWLPSKASKVISGAFFAKCMQPFTTNGDVYI